MGALSWKHKEAFGSFPVKNRRDTALVDFFKRAGVPETQIVYLQDKQATQQRIDAAFKTQSKKLGPNDLLIVYYAGHGYESEKRDDVYLASYDAGDDDVPGWSVNSIPDTIKNNSKCSPPSIALSSARSSPLPATWNTATNIRTPSSSA